jgi:hypothetical protein
MKRYPWEIGSKLAFQIQAKDLEEAEKSITFLFNYISNDSNLENFSELKLRMLQVLTIASAYTDV